MDHTTQPPAASAKTVPLIPNATEPAPSVQTDTSISLPMVTLDQHTSLAVSELCIVPDPTISAMTVRLPSSKMPTTAPETIVESLALSSSERDDKFPCQQETVSQHLNEEVSKVVSTSKAGDKSSGYQGLVSQHIKYEVSQVVSDSNPDAKSPCHQEPASQHVNAEVSQGVSTEETGDTSLCHQEQFSQHVKEEVSQVVSTSEADDKSSFPQEQVSQHVNEDVSQEVFTSEPDDKSICHQKPASQNVKEEFSQVVSILEPDDKSPCQQESVPQHVKEEVSHGVSSSDPDDKSPCHQEPVAQYVQGEVSQVLSYSEPDEESSCHPELVSNHIKELSEGVSTSEPDDQSSYGTKPVSQHVKEEVSQVVSTLQPDDKSCHQEPVSQHVKEEVSQEKFSSEPDDKSLSHQEPVSQHVKEEVSHMVSYSEPDDESSCHLELVSQHVKEELSHRMSTSDPDHKSTCHKEPVSQHEIEEISQEASHSKPDNKSSFNQEPGSKHVREAVSQVVSSSEPDDETSYLKVPDSQHIKEQVSDVVSTSVPDDKTNCDKEPVLQYVKEQVSLTSENADYPYCNQEPVLQYVKEYVSQEVTKIPHQELNYVFSPVCLALPPETKVNMEVSEEKNVLGEENIELKNFSSIAKLHNASSLNNNLVETTTNNDLVITKEEDDDSKEVGDNAGGDDPFVEEIESTQFRVNQSHNFIKMKTTTKTNWKRNTWPRSLKESKGLMPEIPFDGGNDNELLARIKISFMKMIGRAKEHLENARDKMKVKLMCLKDKMKVTLQCLKDKLSPVVRFLPVIISITALVLALADVATDAAFSYRMCTSQCRCEYSVLMDKCLAPPLCDAGVINGTSVINYCSDINWSIHNYKVPEDTEKACRRKEPWTATDCRCHWTVHAQFEMCMAPHGRRCRDRELNGFDVWRNCLKSRNKSDCDSQPSWSHPDFNAFQLRHPAWCSISIGFIIGPSMLTNWFLLFSLLYNVNYRRFLVTAGISSLANIHWVISSLCLFLMAGIQILPYMCLLLKIIVTWRIWMKNIEEGEDSNNLKSITMIMAFVFACTEDLPQLTLQMMFYLHAVLAWDYWIMGEISWLSVFGVVTSCLSLSKTYMEYSTSINSSSTPALLVLLTAFIAAGGRVLISCLMATVIFEDEVDKENPPTKSWRIFLPVSAAFAIQIVVFLCQHCIRVCKMNCLCEKKNIDSSEYSELDILHRKPAQFSFDLFFTEFVKRSSHEETKCQKLFNVMSMLFAVIRSLVFSVALDGHSHLGLWSSACYATWALWLKLHFFYNMDYNLSTTALTFAMLSYSINLILILLNDSHRNIGILVSVLFVMFPMYSYIMATFQNNKAWEFLFIFIHDVDEYNYYDAQYEDILDILYPIVIVAGLAVMVSIISVVFCIVKAGYTKHLNKEMKKYCVHKLKHHQIKNEGNHKNHTI
ncbi:unnamed protein product [Meganyctiphanes norvegica]|uniref:Uncharacterized protein n=1 Tax=Meganyctiphanes norvegica TaxID=48144 RepID=A0AAV2RZP9_MEGNR